MHYHTNKSLLLELYKERKYYKCLDSATYENLYCNYDYLGISAIGASLISLGRTKEGLRQAALALELCPIESRCDMMLFLCEVCTSNGLFGLCWRIAYEGEKLSAILESPKIANKFRVFKKVMSDSKSENINWSTKKLVKGELSSYYHECSTSTKRYITRLDHIYRSCEAIQNSIQKWENEEFSDTQLDGLVDNIFTTIITPIDTRVFKLLRPKTKHILAITTEYISQVPGTDSSNLAEVPDLLRSYRYKSYKKYFQLCSACIKLKTIEILFMYQSKNLKVAASAVEWLVPVMSEQMEFVTGNYDSDIFDCEDNQCLKDMVFKKVCILVGQIYSQMPLELVNIETLNLIVASLTDNDDYSPLSNSSVGDLIRIKALKVRGIQLKGYEFKSSELDKSILFDMIQQYVTAAAGKDFDDVSKLKDCKHILWGMAVHGGFNLKCFWFFCHLRDYYTTYFETYPIDMRAFMPKEEQYPDILLPREVKFEDYVANMYELLECTERKDMKKIGYDESSQESMIRKVDLSTNHFYVFLEDCDDNPVLVSEDLRENNERSRNLLDLWYSTFIQSHFEEFGKVGPFCCQSVIPRPLNNYFAGCFN